MIDKDENEPSFHVIREVHPHIRSSIITPSQETSELSENDDLVRAMNLLFPSS